MICITAFKTKHIDPSYAYLVEAVGKRVLFGGDLCNKGTQEDFPVSVLDKPLDLAVCEAAHFKADTYLPVFEGNENLKCLCFTHYVDKNIASIFDVKAALPGVDAFRAQDGMEITI